MEAALFTLPSSKFRPPPPPSSSAALSLKTHLHNPLFFPSAATPYRKVPRRALTIRSVISREKKQEIIAIVKEQLEDCYFIAGINYEGFTVQQFQQLRRSLPEKTKLLVAKNRLVLKAFEGTPWEALKPCMKGMNAYMFVHSEEIPAAIKPFRDFQKEKKLEENDFIGAVFEGKYYQPEEFKALENMPTREEVYAKILGSLKSPATAVVGTLQAPARNLVMTLKAYVKKLEEESGGGA